MVTEKEEQTFGEVTEEYLSADGPILKTNDFPFGNKVITCATQEGKELIEASWKRSLANKVEDHTSGELRHEDFERILKRNSALINIAISNIESVVPYFPDLHFTLTLTDDQGVPLFSFADKHTLRQYEEWGVRSASRQLSEEYSGTCAHAVAIKHKRPVLLKGKENYLLELQQIACAAFPLMIETTLIGTISLSSGEWDVVDRMVPCIELVGKCITLEYKESCLNAERKALQHDIIEAMDTVDASVYICDFDGRILHKNHVAERLYAGLVALFEENDVANLLANNHDLLDAFRNRVSIMNRSYRPDNLADTFSYSCKFYEPLHQCLIVLKPSAKMSPPLDSDTEKQTDDKEKNFSRIVFTSSLMKKAIDLSLTFACYDDSILFVGESGVGKEMFAQAIHNTCRPHGPFVAVNCAAMPASLLESELFGYVEGAFTGASKYGKAGKFEQANRGTIFLDEIGDMPMEMQPALLRVLQNKQVWRIGSDKSVAVDFRVIASTNKDLEKAVEEGKFRLDLFYRLAVFTIPIPALRERKEDILLLANYFIHVNGKRFNKEAVTLSDTVAQALMAYPWPGNVRELENAMLYALGCCQHEIIQLQDLPQRILSRASATYEQEFRNLNLADNLCETERRILCRALEQSGNNKRDAAKLLGISRTTLYAKLKEHDLLSAPNMAGAH